MKSDVSKARSIIKKYPTWESFHESKVGKTYKDFIGRTQKIGYAEHDKRISRYQWEAIAGLAMKNPVRIPEKVLAWRERKRKDSIMRPRTFKRITKKATKRYGRKRAGPAVGGKAYWITTLRKYLDTHPGDMVATRTLNQLMKRRYKAKKKRNPPSTIIYDRLLRMEAQKGKIGKFKGKHFYHDFRHNTDAMVVGNPDGSLTIKSKRGKRLWKRFNY